MVSDLFIRMCKEAKELQEDWEPKDGDQVLYNAGPFDKELGFVKHVKGNLQLVMKTEWLKPFEKHMLWIPRQEDLQSILSKTWLVSESQVLYKFIDWVNDIKLEFEPETITIYWLCFYMHMEHSMEWNGKAWETIV